MKVYASDKILNLVFVGAKGAGKTSVLDALAYVGGANTRHGKVNEGTSLFDYESMAVAKKATFHGAYAAVEWHDHKINLLDTPGLADFYGDAIAGMCAGDIIVLCVDAVTGVHVHTKRLCDFARAHHKPVVLLVTKMDHPQANHEAVIDSCRESLGARLALLQMPLGAGAQFQGVVGLFHLQAYVSEHGKTTVKDSEGEVLAAAHEVRTEIMDDVAETDEALMAKYLEGTPLTDAELHHGMANGIDDGSLVPVVFTSAETLGGIEAFLTMAVDWLPNPTEVPLRTWKKLDSEAEETLLADPSGGTVIQVFKATSDPGIGDICFFRVVRGTVTHGNDLYNVRSRANERMGHLFVFKGKERYEVADVQAGDIGAVAKLKLTAIGDTLAIKHDAGVLPAIPFPEPIVQLALNPESKADHDKLGGGLAKLMASDPTLRVRVDPEFHETVVSGLGEVHLEVVFQQLKDRYNIAFAVGKPHIPYRERLQKKVRVQGKYKKQSGGRGQYGDCHIEASPLPIGEGFIFEQHIFGGSIPAKYIPAIEKGVREAMQKGQLAGFPLTDLKVDVLDGSYHDVDSSDLAFQIAGSMALKKAQEEAKSILTEPIMQVEVTTPQDFVGDLTSDISGRRGRVQGMDAIGEHTTIRAHMPLAELYKYATSLRSITGGAASHSMQFSHYELVPPHVAERVIAEAKSERENEEKRKAS